MAGCAGEPHARSQHVHPVGWSGGGSGNSLRVVWKPAPCRHQGQKPWLISQSGGQKSETKVSVGWVLRL